MTIKKFVLNLSIVTHTHISLSSLGVSTTFLMFQRVTLHMLSAFGSPCLLCTSHYHWRF